jgi:hypothetical protein
MTKRHSQDTARNWPGRKLGSVIIDHCWQCPAYMIRACMLTGEKIEAPLSGAIPDTCTLEKANRGG